MLVLSHGGLHVRLLEHVCAKLLISHLVIKIGVRPPVDRIQFVFGKQAILLGLLQLLQRFWRDKLSSLSVNHQEILEWVVFGLREQQFPHFFSLDIVPDLIVE